MYSEQKPLGMSKLNKPILCDRDDGVRDISR